MNASDAEQFFFFNIIPKLQAHGLADNQREAGFKYRRGFLNKKGQALFAEVERKWLLAKGAVPTQAPQAKAPVPQKEKLPAKDLAKESRMRKRKSDAES